VHPERYALVEKIATDLAVPVTALVGDMKLIARVDPKRYVGGDVGEFTLTDILNELKKPGRDPRATFEPPKFRDDVRTMEDLKQGMELEGVVTNVTAFGAFVDVGVHQDGLVHVSQLADRFVKDPSEVVKVGEKIKVRVLEVDLARKRISLTAKKGDRPQAGAPQQQGRAGQQGPQQGGGGGKGGPQQGGKGSPQGKPQPQGKFTNNPFATLLKR
jgi:protein Tex